MLKISVKCSRYTHSTCYLKFNMKCKRWKTFSWTWSEIKDALKLWRKWSKASLLNWILRALFWTLDQSSRLQVWVWMLMIRLVQRKATVRRDAATEDVFYILFYIPAVFKSSFFACMRSVNSVLQRKQRLGVSDTRLISVQWQVDTQFTVSFINICSLKVFMLLIQYLVPTIWLCFCYVDCSVKVLADQIILDFKKK